MRHNLLDALALLLPIACAGCGADDRALCPDCRAALHPVDPIVRRIDGLRVTAGLAYAGAARAVVLAAKAGDRPGLAGALAPALAAAVRAAEQADAAAGGADAPLALVAIPSTRAARRRRGFDPVLEIIARAGLRTERVFAPARPHRAQKELAIDERAANLADAFRVRRPVAGTRILLVDDVVTTGSTLLAAAAALRDAGAVVVGAAAVASTPRRRPADASEALGYPLDEG